MKPGVAWTVNEILSPPEPFHLSSEGNDKLPFPRLCTPVRMMEGEKIESADRRCVCTRTSPTFAWQRPSTYSPPIDLDLDLDLHRAPTVIRTAAARRSVRPLCITTFCPTLPSMRLRPKEHRSHDVWCRHSRPSNAGTRESP